MAEAHFSATFGHSEMLANLASHASRTSGDVVLHTMGKSRAVKLSSLANLELTTGLFSLSLSLCSFHIANRQGLLMGVAGKRAQADGPASRCPGDGVRDQAHLEQVHGTGD